MSSSRFEVTFVIYIGAFVYWMFSGFKKNGFKQQLAQAHDNRNMWTGYAVNMAALGGVVYLFLIGHR